VSHILNIQDAYINLFNRQKEIPELQLDCSGIASYIGTLPPSSQHYINNDKFIKHITLDNALGLPSSCPMSCVYCPNYIIHKPYVEPEYRKGKLPDDHKNYLISDALLNYNETIQPAVLFGGPTDPLLFSDTIKDIINFYQEEIRPSISQDIWYHSYTTGMFLSEECIKDLASVGLKEIIFHIGASHFSEKAFNSMRISRKYIDTITVETPSWIPHKQQLFDMLPVLQEIGVDHLNLTSIDVNNNNKTRIMNEYPNTKMYKVHNVVMDDDGLVYDVMKKVIEKGYTYSVFDLNNFVVMHSQGEARQVEL
jgi:pyruvate formate-lyase activating enzyme-like uncharacterized protein